MDFSSLDNQTLVKTFQKGTKKKKAFRELYDRYERSLRNYLVRLTGDLRLAEDLTQEAFMRALEHLEQFNRDSSFKTWLYRIATNTWKNHLKKKRPVSGVIEEEDTVSQTLPQQEVEKRENIQRVRRALDALPEKYRVPIVLVRFEGMKYREAAETIGITLEAFQSRLYRAQKKLKEKLHDQ